MTIANRIEELTATLTATAATCMPPESRSVYRTLVLLLAKGAPVSVEDVARAMGIAREDAMQALSRTPSLEWDEAGMIVGAGLTLRRTPYRFRMEGCTLFTWCALDTLIFPSVIGQKAEVESACAATGTPVRVTVTPEGVKTFEPREAVISCFAGAASGDVRRVFCQYSQFFQSAESAAGWLAAHPGGTTLTVPEAYKLGRLLTESFLERSGQVRRES
ncbi:MAG: organomercurial lyase MerB [Terriglobia bacterium]